MPKSMGLTKEEMRERKRAQDKAGHVRRRERGCLMTYKSRVIPREQPLVIPREVLDEFSRLRDARGRQDFFSYMAGDPPPGFSALDQRSE